MPTFHIYPKEGERFALAFERFEVRGDHFVIYNDRSKESHAGFLSLANIAAILPDRLPDGERIGLTYETKPIEFLIYLKGRPPTDPIRIQAFSCDVSEPPSVKLFWKVLNQNRYEDYAMTNLYIAISEVVAIMPSGGLESKP